MLFFTSHACRGHSCSIRGFSPFWCVDYNKLRREMWSSIKFIWNPIIFCYRAMLRFLYFLFFPKLIVIFCLSDVRLALFDCYRKEQTRGCREGKHFLKWDIRGAALQEPSILVKMIPRTSHSTVKVSIPQCIYKTGCCIDIFIPSNSWRFWFFASYCTHLIWCLIVAIVQQWIIYSQLHRQV